MAYDYFSHDEDTDSDEDLEFEEEDGELPKGLTDQYFLDNNFSLVLKNYDDDIFLDKAKAGATHYCEQIDGKEIEQIMDQLFFPQLLDIILLETNKRLAKKGFPSMLIVL